MKIVAGPKAVQVTPDGPAWTFLGGGNRYLYVLPQSQMDGLPFLGLNSEALPAEAFAAAPTITLTSVEGPGDFFLYQVDAFGEPVVHMNSGAAGEDSYVLPLGTHVHMNWAFGEPGEYELTFEIRATLADDTQILSEPQVVHFHVVGHTTYIHEDHVDVGLHYEAGYGMHFYVAAGEHEHEHEEEHAHEHEGEHEDEGHEHGEEMHPADVTFLLSGYAIMAVPEADELAFLGTAGTPVYLVGSQPAEGVPFLGWNTEELDPAVFTDNLLLELHGVDGPGDVFLWGVDAFGTVNLLWDSTNPGEDVMTMPAGIHSHYNLAVTQPGIYELDLHAKAILATGDEVHAETVLTFQAGGMEGYFGHFGRLAPNWIEAETGGWLYTADWPWLLSPEQGWLYAWGEGGPEHLYFRAEDSSWLWTAPGVFPYFWSFDATGWSTW